MKLAAGRWPLFAALALGLAAAWLAASPRLFASSVGATPPVRLALLVADGVDDADPRLLVWQEAAAELGFALDTVRASAWMRSPGDWRDAALILPDALHRRANDLLVGAVIRHVDAGGLLMLVHDAATADLADVAAPRQARLSALAGVRYALQPTGAGGRDARDAAERTALMFRQQPAWTTAAAARRLQVPPGKLLREADGEPLTSAQPEPSATERLHVAAYGYGRLDYPSFATDEGAGYAGQALLRGDDGTLLAGLSAAGRGQVLFVNLPLGWLKLRTDGFFLHALLRLYAQDVAGLPQLSTVPGGVGAQVMNWHVDANAAVPAMAQLAALGVLEQGPYSVHLTAGPDVDAAGDGRGMALDSNETMRRWVASLAAGGHEIGSHGGWTHNEFGRLVTTQPRERSVSMIERNIRSVESASGRAVREYSAPVGNHPAWVTDWLRARGVVAYYFTGDSGMAPTRSFQDGVPAPPGMWSFPVTNFGSIAAFEEADREGEDDDNLGAWLSDLAEFCARHRTLRLTYFHPPGAVRHPRPFVAWLQRSAALGATGRLRWMTMAQVTDFLEHRRAARWRVEAATGPAGVRLVASHPTSLESMSWLLPAARWAQPRVSAGRATVTRDGEHWRIDALGGTQLAVDLPAAARPATAATAGA